MGKSQLGTGAAGLQRSMLGLQLHFGSHCFLVNFSKVKQQNFGFLFLAVVFLWD